MSATVPQIIYVMYGCSAAIYNGFKPVLPQCRLYIRACVRVHYYILYIEVSSSNSSEQLFGC